MQKLEKLMDLHNHHRPDVGLEDLAAVGPVATRHINLRRELHFPLKELAERVLQAPVKVLATPGN